MERNLDKFAGNKQPSEVKIVKLDFQADIIAAIEAVRFNKQDHLVFVLPDSAKDFEVFFNLRLLKQVCLVLNKQITLITINEKTIKLAKSLEISIKSSLEEDKQVIKEPPIAETKLSETASKPKDLAPKVPTARRESVVESGGVGFKGRSEKSGRNFLINLIIFFLIFTAVILAIYIFSPYHATVNIQTDVSRFRVNLQADLSQSIQSVNTQRKILPLVMKSQDSKIQQEIFASGSTDGQKASGIIEVYNCNTETDLVVNTQTVFRKDDKDFSLKADNLEIIIPPGESSEDCESASAVGNRRSLRIEANEIGEDHNLEAGGYQIIGLTDDNYSVRGFDIEGGRGVSSCITADDLEDAQEAFAQKRNDTEAKRQLMNTLEFEDNLIPLASTFQVAEAEILEPPTCPEITDNKISQVIVYYLGGVKKEDVSKLIEIELQKAANELVILDSGLETANYDVRVRLGGEQPKPTVQQPADLNYYVTINIDQATAGIIFDKEEILDQIAGSKAKQVGSQLRSLKGVEEVQVEFSPFWAFWLTNLPEDKDKIMLNIDNQEREENNLINEGDQN